MSEKSTHRLDSELRHNHEYNSASHESRIRAEVNHNSERSIDHSHTQEALRKHIDKIAQHAESQHKQHHERPHHYITKDVKAAVYVHTLKNVQLHLKTSERVFSKIIHNNVVESISEVGSKTIARPGSIIGGGILMIFGGIILYLFAKYYGFYLPLSSLIALYVMGFFAVFIIDVLKTLILKIKR